MREIKFRAWEVNWDDKNPDSNQGKMLYKIPIEAVNLSKELDFYGTSLQIMQFTGLKDKNSKEIYEGDKSTTYFLIITLPLKVMILLFGCRFGGIIRKLWLGCLKVKSQILVISAP